MQCNGRSCARQLVPFLARGEEMVRGATYEGTPCKKAGHTLRYVNRGTCVACLAQYNACPKRKQQRANYNARPERKPQNAKRHKQWAANNREHLRSYRRKWHEANPEKRRVYNKRHYRYDYAKSRAKALRRHFGLSVDQVEAMRTAQKSKCAICRTSKPGGQGDWHVDHNHQTKQVRALLCQNCNIGLGNFKDDPVRLIAAAEYLRKHQNNATMIH